jgi:hypothetical protein
VIPDNPASGLPKSPDYSPGASFDLQKFTRNDQVNNGTAGDAVKSWQGKNISGRYAQKGDSHGLTERVTFIPRDLLKAKDFPSRGLLPHHNEIAVDEDTRGKKHVLYADNKVYTEQYRLRYDAAARHIREAFKKYWKP